MNKEEILKLLRAIGLGLGFILCSALVIVNVAALLGWSEGMVQALGLTAGFIIGYLITKDYLGL